MQQGALVCLLSRAVKVTGATELPSSIQGSTKGAWYRMSSCLPVQHTSFSEASRSAWRVRVTRGYTSAQARQQGGVRVEVSAV